MESKLTLVRVDNPFDRRNKTVKMVPYERQSLAEIKKMFAPVDIPMHVTINGVTVPQDKLEFCVPIEGDQVTFIPTVHGGGGGGKSGLRGIVNLIVAVIVTVATYGYGATIMMMAMTAAMAVTNLAMNLLFPVKAADTTTPQVTSDNIGNEEATQTYSWNPTTTQAQGGVVPRAYGTMKLYGNVIDAYSESDQSNTDNQYLHCLICLGVGRISSIYDYYLNDQPIANFTGVTIETRLGYINQLPLSGFNCTKTENIISQKVDYGYPYTFTTTEDDFEGLEIEIQFPKGIYYVNDQGVYVLNGCAYGVEARIQGGSWVTLSNGTFQTPAYNGSQHWSIGYWSYGGLYVVGSSYQKPNANAVWIEVANGGSDENAYYEGQYVTSYGCDAWARWSAGWTYTSLSQSYAQNNTTKTLRFVYKTMLPATNKGKWEVRVSRYSADDPSTRYCSQLYFYCVRLIRTDDQQYPRHALVGVRALATDQLSGSLRFSCMIKGAMVRVYDGSKFSIQFSDNPAWVCYDVLSQPVLYDQWRANYYYYAGDYICPTTLNNRKYRCVTAGWSTSTEPTWSTTIGVNTQCGTAFFVCEAGATLDGVARIEGFDDANLDVAKFKEWADYCDELCPDNAGGTEKRVTFNGAFDSQKTTWDAAMSVAQMARACLIWYGNKISVMVDKPTASTWMVSVGNIGLDSFKETFLPIEDRATEIECTFNNKEIDYGQDKISVFNVSSDAMPSRTSLDGFGITKASELWRLAMWHLNANTCLLRTVEIQLDIDAVACMVGDVIEVQHDVPEWGSAGGRIVTADSTSVTIDKEVTLDTGTVYEILIRLQDDSLVTKVISNVPGTYTVLTVSVPFADIPQQYDPYAFGPTNYVTKPFRVIGIQKNQEQMCTLHLAEYDEDVYQHDDLTPAVPTYNYSLLDPVPKIESITLSERLYYGVDGTIKNGIDVTYQAPSSTMFGSADFWYHYDSGPWKFAGNSSKVPFLIQDVDAGYDVTVAALAVSSWGLKQSLETAPTATIHVLGKEAPPSNVTGFWAQPAINGIRLDWTPISDPDLANYEIRWNPIKTAGAIWDNSNVCAIVGRDATSKTFSAMMSGKYLIKAMDTTGHYSETACELLMDVPKIAQFEEVFHIEEDPTWAGTCDSSCMIDNNDQLTLQPIGLFDDETDIDAINNWDYLSAGVYAEGYYTSATTISLGAILTLRLSAVPVWMSMDFESKFENWSNVDAMTNWDGDNQEGTYVTPQISLSQNGVDYADWQEFIMGDFSFYSAKFRIKLSTIHANNPCRAPFVVNFDWYGEAPQRREYGNDLSVGVGGATITYTTEFFSKPVINITIQTASSGDYPYISAQSETGFTIAIRNGGSNVARTIDWASVGY